MVGSNTQKQPDTDAEHEVIAVYRKKVYPLFGIAIAVGVVVCAAIWLYFHRFQYVVAVVVAVILATLPLLIESRRKVIFTASEFIFNANSGESGRIPLAQIAAFNETSTVHLLGAMPSFVPAVQLVLTNGQVRTVPLDFPDRQKILARLREIIADRSRR
jgi:hypothetical protein